MIFVDSAWEEVRNAALEHFVNKYTWTSPVQRKEYSIKSIIDNSIYINRLSGGKPTVLTKRNVERMVEELNVANGRVARGELDDTVAVETAFVHLHPLVSLVDDYIVEIQSVNELSNTTKVSLNVNLQRQLYARNVRRGQAWLRNRMLNIYSGKCCISETGPVNVLEAAHIEAHSISGLDDPSNAILLRADLHNLFDDNLLGIHPETFQVYIDSSLSGTIYAAYHLKSLQPRNDQSIINISKLKKKWNEFSTKAN